mmetsp:Transcript_30678/g.91811  ORF Transcript_30678/g.91811 Transcript_30678/m.91811 type:complete len:258 (-) Transcript_30678:913-1686(-)
MREVTKDVGAVQSRHGNFTAAHLEEGGKGGEDSLLGRVHTEPGGGGEIAAFHDSGLYVNFRIGRLNLVEVGRSAQIGIDHHDGFLPLRRVHLAQDVDDGLTDRFAHGVVRADSLVRLGILGLGGELEVLHGVLASLGFEVRDGRFHGDGVVSLAGALHAVDSRGHGTLAHHGGGTVDPKHRAARRVQVGDVFPLGIPGLEAVPLQRLLDAESGQILGGMSRDGNIIVVQYQFHVQPPRHRQSGRLGVIPLHLAPVAP